MNNMNDIFPNYILNKKASEIARERNEWIDSTIAKALPEWKRKVLEWFPNRFVARFLLVNVEIINETLIGNFGTKVRIILNGKVIGERNYKL